MNNEIMGYGTNSVMNNNNREATCKYCGAVVTTEVCPYCHCETGIDPSAVEIQYPVLECKEATINFWSVAFPAIFALAFGFFGFGFPLIFIGMGGEAMTTDSGDVLENWVIYLFCLPFALVGIGAAVITLKPIIRYILLRINGTRITGKVYGYTNDSMYMNGTPAQTAKILVDTPEGYRFIMYQLGDVIRPYPVNSEVNIIAYKSYFLIEKPKPIQWKQKY